MIHAALLITASLTLGQAAEPSAYEHLKVLECFVGTWEAESVLPESSGYSETVAKWAGKPVKLRMNVKWAPGKSAQILDFFFEIPGEVKITETALRGWDQTKKKIVSSSFTTHMGVWSATMEKAGDKWVSKFEGFNLDGEKCTGTRTSEFVDDDTFLMKATDQTTGGKQSPDIKYLFKRVMTVPSPSGNDELKELGFLVGEWEAKKKDGSRTHWTFKWTPNENVLENVLTGTNAAGDETFQNRGMMGWDARSRRITNRCFTQNGNPVDFIWAKSSEGVWHNWPAGGKATWSVTPIDNDSWRMVGTGETQIFERVKKPSK